VLMTEWNEYRNLDLCEIKKSMRGNAFIDLRNIYERESLEDMGFIYTAVGR
jgi:UDPglucose 6-dehydrogenase